MKLLTSFLSLLLTGGVSAFPPAPHHELYGTVRDETGTPLSGSATIRLHGPSGPVISGQVDPSIDLGVNYSLKVPMDAGTQAQLYHTSALLPAQPFTVEVIVDGTSHVPIEAQGPLFSIGTPGERTLLNLTLGVDSDGDGLPDSWEQQVIAGTDANSLTDITPDGDNDGDGVSNFIEYLAGTYAFTDLASFSLEVIEVKDGFARCRFLATKGRTYTLSGMSSSSEMTRIPFSTNPDGTDLSEVFHSELIRFEDIYIPTDGFPSRIFQLHVH